MEYAYSRVYGCYFNTFYEVEFYVDFRGCVFGLSFQSNIWIDDTCFVYGLSLWYRFTGRVCDPSFQIEFTDIVYECGLLVIFSGWLCRSSSRVNFTSEFRVSLMDIWDGLTNRDYGSCFLGQIWWPSLLVRFTGRVLESRLQFVIRIVLYKVKF